MPQRFGQDFVDDLRSLMVIFLRAPDIVCTYCVSQSFKIDGPVGANFDESSRLVPVKKIQHQMLPHLQG